MALFNKKKGLSALMEGFHDIHSHLLPGVDDGSPSAEHTSKLLAELERLGVKGAYATPHIISGLYHNKDEHFLRSEFSKLSYDGSIDLRLAAEYFIDDSFLEHVNASPLTLGNDHIMVEFDLRDYGIQSLKLLFEASLTGYNIIIAHPERYSFIQKDKSGQFLGRLTDSGYKLQLNLLSVTGFYGKNSQETALYLLNEGKYDFVGTDIHSGAHISAIGNAAVPEKIFHSLERLKRNNETLF